MKKMLALILAMMMVLTLVACNSDGDSDGPGDINKVDLSKFPAKLEDWSAKDLLEYFKESTDLPTDQTGWEEWYRDEEWYAGNVVNTQSGTWKRDDASVQLFFYVLKPDAPDTTPEAVEEVFEVLRTDSTHTEPHTGITATHLACNIAFCYEWTTDDAYYEAFEEVYQRLISEFGITPDF